MSAQGYERRPLEAFSASPLVLRKDRGHDVESKLDAVGIHFLQLLNDYANCHDERERARMLTDKFSTLLSLQGKDGGDEQQRWRDDKSCFPTPTESSQGSPSFSLMSSSHTVSPSPSVESLAASFLSAAARSTVSLSSFHSAVEDHMEVLSDGQRTPTRFEQLGDDVDVSLRAMPELCYDQSPALTTPELATPELWATRDLGKERDSGVAAPSQQQDSGDGHVGDDDEAAPTSLSALSRRLDLLFELRLSDQDDKAAQLSLPVLEYDRQSSNGHQSLRWMPEPSPAASVTELHAPPAALLPPSRPPLLTSSDFHIPRKPVPAYHLPHSTDIMPPLLPLLPEMRVLQADEVGSVIESEKASVVLEFTEKPPSRWRRWGARCRAWVQSNYIVLDADPSLLLATPPSDTEKLTYVNTKRIILCAMAFFTFLCSSGGVWLFIVCGSLFYWFAGFFIIGQVSFALFQLSSAMGRRFSHEQHLATLARHPLALSDDCPASLVEGTPSVDIYLPCCKEPLDVLENTYVFVQQLQWPASKLKVHVLDDGYEDSVRDLAARYDFNYIRRSDRGHLKKAGNLRNAFAETTGDFFVILDADFCPRADFLRETVPLMLDDETLGILQTPQFFRTLKTSGAQTWVERGAGATQEVFYRLIQTCRNTWGAVICAGSCALYRREALKKLGGTAPLESSEDIFTGFYLTLDGWKVNYLPINLSCGICPNTARAYYSQQLRWCEGSCSLVLAKEFWVSKLNWKAKALYFSGLLYYVDHALSPFFLPLTAILMIWFRISVLTVYNLAFAIPSIIFGYWLSRFWSTAKHAKSVQFVNVLQSYAYASALLDRVVGSKYAWVPSGDAKAHKSNRYRNSRWLCITYTFATSGALIAGIVYQHLAGHALWLFAPVMALQLYCLHTTLPFMLAVH